MAPFKTGVALLATAFAGLAHADDTVRVRVHAEHAAGRVVYHYQIENRGRTDLRQIFLGCECRPADHIMVPLLETVPVGGQSGEPHYAASSDPRLLPELARTPPGWQVHARRPPGADKYWLEWHAVGPRGLAPGQVVKGFSVALPKPDRAFLIGRYTVPERNGFGTLEPLDATPPRLALKLEEVAPLRPGETVRVRVVASVEDDFDPAPILAFESFTPDETQAPVSAIDWSGGATPARTLRYTVTYSATDASGNTARTSLKITLPATPAGRESVMLPTAANCPTGRGPYVCQPAA